MEPCSNCTVALPPLVVEVTAPVVVAGGAAYDRASGGKGVAFAVPDHGPSPAAFTARTRKS